MTRLVIIRHGPTAWNAEKRLQGHSDIPLSAAGRKMVATWRLPDGLSTLQWVSSPLQRALDTARLMGAPDNIALEHRLREIGYGAWEGRTYAELTAEIGEDRLQAMQDTGLDYGAPGGESRREFHERLTSWLADVSSNGAPALAFAHQGVIRALVAMSLDWDYVGEPPRPYAGLRIRAVAHDFSIAVGGAIAINRLNLPLGAAAASD